MWMKVTPIEITSTHHERSKDMKLNARTTYTRAAAWAVTALSLGAGLMTADAIASDRWDNDFGLRVERILNLASSELFGIDRPVVASALGPFADPDNRGAVIVAAGLRVGVVSNVTDPQADMIALWPNDEHPSHLFVCVESFFSQNSNPGQASVQRVTLNADPNSNVETIVKGISSCDPIRRTPWGTLVVGEESGANGGLYEILDPMGIDAANPVAILDRAAGTSSDPTRVAKRKAVGSLSWEGNVILEDGTMYMSDELRPSNGKAGGGVYKFVPATPYQGAGPITTLDQSPFVSGTLYGLRVGTRNNNTDYGQGSETGKGVWLAIDPAAVMDANGNIILGNAQQALKLTGYYRPEDMDLDPIAAKQGIVRVCGANTGRMTNGVDSAIEDGANYGEVTCLVDAPKVGATSGAVPQVTRFIAGDRDANHFDNLAFQPHSGRLVVQEDGEVEVLNADGSVKELRGNDIWMCLPDGADRDVQSDGCVRILSIKDTDAESTGVIFDASGETAYVNIQHRATGQGALLRISGFDVD
jgi:hypothetical protein